MSYETAKTIFEIIDNIDKKKYVLPAIQREFIWSTFQIERIFDSILLDYPINSFLFWEISKENVKKYDFYEFIRNYHEVNRKHNEKASLNGDDNVLGILDGQQRLTSLYIGLKGSYSYRLPRKRWDNPNAYPQRKLYLNILKRSENVEVFYDFRFLTDEEAQENDSTHLWYCAGDILDCNGFPDVNRYIIEKRLMDPTLYDQDVSTFASDTLFNLYEKIHSKLIISYYLEKSQVLDKVLNIFIRINSGGSILSYSDLLLSIATAQWEKKDAREEVLKFVDVINNIGDGFDFNKDFVLKSCLVLTEKDIAFKVDNFSKNNMLDIENQWDSICNSIRLSVELISDFGFNRDRLTSNNAIIPIAYYIHSIGNPENFVKSVSYAETRKKIHKWLIIALVKRTFGGQPDNVLFPMRKVIAENHENGFPIQEIIEVFRGRTKSMIFTDDDIENLLHVKYGTAMSFSVLSLLYPAFDFGKSKFHEDHIHPKSFFTESKLRKRGYDDVLIKEYIECFNYLSNLQLLEAHTNIDKSDKEFTEWFDATFNFDQEKNDFKKKHFIPNETDFSFDNFLTFFNNRKGILKNELTSLLQI